MTRFNYVNYDEQSTSKQNKFKNLVEELENTIEVLLEDGREKSLSITKLEEIYTWIGKSIKVSQEKRQNFHANLENKNDTIS